MEKLRPEVVSAASLDEDILQQNDWKGGWKELPVEWLLLKLDEEVAEFKRAVLEDHIEVDFLLRSDLAKEGADVRNVVMMILDNKGCL